MYCQCPKADVQRSIVLLYKSGQKVWSNLISHKLPQQIASMWITNYHFKRHSASGKLGFHLLSNLLPPTKGRGNPPKTQSYTWFKSRNFVPCKVSIPGNSLCPFWDGENVTPSKVVGDLQLGDEKVTNWITWSIVSSNTKVHRFLIGWCTKLWLCQHILSPTIMLS